MPLVCSTSRIKAVGDISSLSLAARHCCNYGNDNDTVFTAKSRFPDIVDVLIASSVVFRITATLEGKKFHQKHSNSVQLGLTNVSSVYMDSECGTPSVSITSSRCMPETKRTCLILSTVHLCYEWKTRPNFKPFARNLPLPGLALLDNVLTRFVSWHLVKRYPLAFGTWHKVRITLSNSIEASFVPPWKAIA
ncbi:hypothetical protein CPB85DRAFT_1499107 [Mucidula mucida]|nr:hypothetical protein CPB85DRAFT_1499107 [Mucidula mucida]